MEKKSKLTIFNHIESKHLKSLKFQCNYCGVFRANRSALGYHISSEHKGQTGTFLPADSHELPLEVLIQEDPQDWSMLEMPSDISLELGYDSYNNNGFDEDQKVLMSNCLWRLSQQQELLLVSSVIRLGQGGTNYTIM